MATNYSLSTNTNVRELTGRAVSDTLNTNGFSFTIDQDSRYGLNGTTSAVWAGMTINTSLGGNINIDGRYVRLIPFTGGSGTIVAGNTITCGSATGVVIGIYSGFTSGPVLTGVATGWIKVTAWNSVAFPTSGTYTQAGYTFTISGVDIVGFIEVTGTDGAGDAIETSRLGELNITGEWFSLGTTDSTLTKTFQLPTHGLLRHASGVWVEQTAGQKDYEFYPNAGTAATVGTEAERGKVCWITSAGLVRIGQNNTPATMGHHPGTGKEVVIGNIWLTMATTVAPTVNVIPNASFTSRYYINSTAGGGVVSISKSDVAWGVYFTNGYSLDFQWAGFLEGIYISNLATSFNPTRIGVGQKPTTALVISALDLRGCPIGGTITDCVFSKITHANATGTINVSDSGDLTFVRTTFRGMTNRTSATATSCVFLRSRNIVLTDCYFIIGNATFTNCVGITGTNTTYIQQASSTTVTSYVSYIWSLVTTQDVSFEGVSLPVTNNHPYTALLSIAVSSRNVTLINAGTKASPLPAGSSAILGSAYAAASDSSNITVKRVYMSDARAGCSIAANTCIDILEESIFGGYYGVDDQLQAVNHQKKGIKNWGLFNVNAGTSSSVTYGSHWWDNFTGTSTGYLNLCMNEPTASTALFVTLTGTSRFNSKNNIVMPTVGDTATFEMAYFALGHTGFDSAGTLGVTYVSGGVDANYSFDYAIDKNDGNGFSTMTTSAYSKAGLLTALAAITGIDASLGIKVKLKITTVTANSGLIKYVQLPTTSSDTAQGYQYPLYYLPLQLLNVVVGSEYWVAETGNLTNVLATGTAAVSEINISVPSEVTSINVTIRVRKGTSGSRYLPFETLSPLTSSGSSVYVSQVLDQIA